jgi:hypothetical protein
MTDRLRDCMDAVERVGRRFDALQVRRADAALSDPVFELGDHFVVPVAKGGYEVYRNEGTAAVRCAQIGAGYPGGSLQKAKDECRRREALPDKGRPASKGRRRADEELSAAGFSQRFVGAKMIDWAPIIAQLESSSLTSFEVQKVCFDVTARRESSRGKAIEHLRKFAERGSRAVSNAKGRGSAA